MKARWLIYCWAVLCWACGGRAALQVDGTSGIATDASTAADGSSIDGARIDRPIDARTGPRLLEGEPIALGNGVAWVWAVVAPDHRVVEVGLAVTREALDAPASPWVHTLDFPPVAQVKSFFHHLTLSLARQPAIGGSPELRPYLELHFFTIDHRARRAIDCRDARLPLWELPAPYRLADAADATCVLERGFHALPDATTDEPTGFASALAVYAGQLIAINLAVDRNWWKRGEPHEMTLAVPAKLPGLTLWPTRLSVQLDQAGQVYRFGFRDFIPVPYGFDPRPPPPPLDAGINYGPRPDVYDWEPPCGGNNKPCNGGLPTR